MDIESTITALLNCVGLDHIIFTLKCQTPIKWNIYGQLNKHSDFNSGSCGGFNHSKSETP
jgi:hypothetical protein